MAHGDFAKNLSLIDFSTEKIRDIKEWLTEPRTWTKSPFRKHTTSAESHLLYHYAKQLGPGNYADVGVMHGGSTVTIAYGLSDGEHKAKLFAVDLFGTGQGPDKGSNEAPQNLFSYFNEHFPNIELNICIGESAYWGQKVQEKFKFVFIDANHSYKNCKADFLAWSPKVENNGMIAFHDTHFEGVDQVIKELSPKEWKLVKHIFTIKLFQKIC